MIEGLTIIKRLLVSPKHVLAYLLFHLTIDKLPDGFPSLSCLMYKAQYSRRYQTLTNYQRPADE